MKRMLFLVVSHLLAAAVGFALGIYALPILIAPVAPSADEVAAQAGQAAYTAQFRRDLKGSDLFHWGEGKVSIGPKSVIFVGKLAPGPDYKLYLSPEFVETEADFKRLKDRMVRIGDVIACPAGGTETAHQIVNTGSEELRYLAVSTKLSPEIAEYPDSGKFGVFAEFPAGADGKPQAFRFLGRESAGVEYWDGE